MKCECPYTLKVPLGNAFQVLFPVKTAEWKDGERTVEVTDVRALTDVKILVDGQEWEQGWEKDDRGPLVNFPKGSLAKGPHNVEITADYFGVAIRAAYFECITMVQWSYESNIGNYIIGSPLVAEAAYIYVGITDDQELEDLKHRYELKIVELQAAIQAAEQAKQTYEEAVLHLDGIAQEETSQAILQGMVTKQDIAGLAEKTDLAGLATAQNVTDAKNEILAALPKEASAEFIQSLFESQS